MNECPMCGKELATYQVTQLGCGGAQDREVGCAKENAPCLLAGKSWDLLRWGQLCGLVAAAGEGYPGAAHDRLTCNNKLRDLHEKWKANACLLNSIRTDDPAACVFFICARELCEATGESGL